MIAVAVVLPSDIDRDMIKLWDARLNTRCPTCSRPTRSEMLTAATKTKCHDRRVALCCRSS